MNALKLKHKCGHEQEYQVSGGNAERERLVAQLAARACSDCRRQASLRRRDSATAWALQEGLPALEGTPRQVAAAEVIRHETLSDMALQQAVRKATVILRGSDDERAKLPAEVRKLMGHPVAGPALNEIATYTLALVDALRAETSAAWWEAHRRGSAWAEVEAKILQRTVALKARIRSAV